MAPQFHNFPNYTFRAFENVKPERIFMKNNNGSPELFGGK